MHQVCTWESGEQERYLHRSNQRNRPRQLLFSVPSVFLHMAAYHSDSETFLQKKASGCFYPYGTAYNRLYQLPYGNF